MLRPSWARIAAVIALLMGAWFAAPASAQAADSCENVIVDMTSGQVLGAQSDIDASVASLEALGADVRVRAFESVAEAGGSLDAYLAQQVANCPSWRGPDGTLKDNLLVYAFSMDHKSAIFYGSNWRGAMEPNVDRIRADYLNAQLKLGNYSAGFATAMDESATMINYQLHPGSAPQGPSIGDSTAGKVIAWLIAIVAGIIGLVIAAIAFVRAQQRRRFKQAELKDAQDAAIKARDDATEELSKLTAFDDSERTTQIVLVDLNAEDVDEVNAVFGKAKSLVNAAYAANSQMMDHPSEFNPEQSLKLEQYKAIEESYNNLSHDVAESLDAMGELDGLCARLQEEIAKAPASLDAAKTHYATTETAIAQLTSQGYKVDVDSKFATAQASLDKAEALVATRKYGMAIGEIEIVTELLGGVDDELTALPKRRQKLQARYDAASSRSGAVKTNLDQATRQLTVLVAQFARPVSSDLITEAAAMDAEERKVRELLATAGESISMQSQQWTKGKRELDDVDQELQKFDEFCARVTSRYNEATQFAGTFSGTLKTLKNKISDTQSEVNGLRGNHHKVPDQLEEVSRLIDELAAASTATKPDVLDLSAQAEAADERINAILKAARRKDAEIREEEERQRRAEEEERRRRERRAREEREEEERRRRRISDTGTGFGAGYVSGGGFSSGGSSGGGFDGGSSGSFGGGGDGGSSGGW